MRRFVQTGFCGLMLLLPAVCSAQLNGDFQYNFTNGPALWDFSGPYSVSNGTFRLANTLVQSTTGALTGTGSAHYDDGLVRVNASETLRGRVAGKASSRLTAKAAGTGQFSGTAFGTAISGPFTASLTFTLDPTNRVLSGTETVKLCIQGRGCRTLSTNVNFQLPDSVDGTWALALSLNTTNNAVRGTATVELPNDRALSFNVRGRYLSATGTSRLMLLGSGEAFGRRLAVRLNSDGSLQALNGNLLGQRMVFP